jgi:hypothetical protein
MEKCASTIRDLEDIASSADMANSVQQLVLRELEEGDGEPRTHVITAIHAVADRIRSVRDAIDDIASREMET